MQLLGGGNKINYATVQSYFDSVVEGITNLEAGEIGIDSCRTPGIFQVKYFQSKRIDTMWIDTTADFLFTNRLEHG